MCLRFKTETVNPTPDITTIHYERCFEELFVIDGEIDVDPVASQIGNFVIPTNDKYGASPMTGNLEFTYPAGGSTQQVDQKAMARIYGGYSATSTPPLTFGSHTLLWYNPLIDLYVLKQPTGTGNSPSSISLSGLTNPEPYQKE